MFCGTPTLRDDENINYFVAHLHLRGEENIKCFK